MARRTLTKQYDRALVLIQYYVQVQWLVFGAFLLSETVLLAAIASVAHGFPNLVFAGAILGLLLTLPWWTSFHYNHSLYLLRIYEARDLEPAEANFFSNGNKLIEGQTLFDGKVCIPKLARFLHPRRSCDLLIYSFIVVFILFMVDYFPVNSLKMLLCNMIGPEFV